MMQVMNRAILEPGMNRGLAC